MKIHSRWLILSVLAAGLQAVSAADITGTVTLTGTPPPEQVNDLIKDDPFCGKLHSEDVKTQFYVVGAKGELKDVVVVLKGVTGKSTGATAPPLVIDQKGCEYIPYIMAAQTGQKISVKNSDATMHTIQPTPREGSGNKGDNKAQMAGGPEVSFTFPSAEDFLKIQCAVHKWMLCYVTIVDSPYFAVTDKDGKFTIANVPPGKYTVTAMHRKAALKGVDKEVEVKGDNATLDFTLAVPKAP